MDLPLPAAMAPALGPHRLEDLLWTWVLPLTAVLLASLAGAMAGRGVPLRADDPLAMAAESPGQGWRRLLRALLQALAFMAMLILAVCLDKAWHGEPRGFKVTAQTGGLVAILWAGFKLLDGLGRHAVIRLHELGRPAASAMLPLLRRVLKLLWLALAVLLYLDNLGMNVSALLAGLGVGGLAVALAGQKTMENLFGGMVLAMDQPVRVGDFCRFGDKQGVVEDVGLRSIKIRTPERTLISVPNGEFSQLQIENVASRDRILFSVALGLRYDSSAEQLRQVLDATENLLRSHARVDKTLPLRSRLIGLGAYSINVEVLCYFATADYDEFMLLRQALILDLLQMVERAGARLAFPTQTLVQEAPQPPL